MDSLLEFLNADDQQVARQLICSQGYELGGADRKSKTPVDASTMVVMTPIDADFFGEQYLYLVKQQPGRWAVLWQNVYDLPSGENVAIQLHRFQSSTDPVNKAVIICSLAQSPAELRGMILYAIDNGVPLEACRVECPWMTEQVYESLSHDFGDDWAAIGLENVVIVPNESVMGVSLSRLLNLPEKGLTYLPACVIERM